MMLLEPQSQGQGQQNCASMWRQNITAPLSRSEMGMDMGMGCLFEMPTYGTSSTIKLCFNLFYFVFHW